MKPAITRSGAAIATAVAALIFTVAVPVGPVHADARGKCIGANACKGHGACKSAANACKGKNACKGQGFTEATAKDCKVAGGKFELPKPAKPAAKKA